MKKKITIITLSFVLGMLCCDLVSAQIYNLGSQLPQQPLLRPHQPIQLMPQSRPQPRLSDNPGLMNRVRDASTSGIGQTERGIMKHLNPGPVSQESLGLPPGTLSVLDPPQNLLPNPLPLPQPGFPLPQPGGLSPQPLPLPGGLLPQPGGLLPPPPTPAPPQPQGPTFGFGPNGPTISFENGPTINIPVRQIADRIRERRQQSPQGGRIMGQGTAAPQAQQPVYDQYGNIIGYIGG